MTQEMAIREIRGLLNFIYQKGRNVDKKTFGVFVFGLVLFFTFLSFSIALMFSGPLMIIGIPVCALWLLISGMSVIITPLVLGGVVDEFMIFPKRIIILRSYIMATIFCLSLLFLPIIGLFLLFVLFIYSFGIICEYIYLEYIK